MIFLAFYLFVFLPATHFFPRPVRWFSEYGYDFFLPAALFYLLRVKKISIKDLGFSFRYCKQNMLIGGLSGGLVLLALPLLDGFLRVTGLEQTELLANAAARSPGGLLATTNPWLLWFPILVHPVLEQLFFLGFVVHSLFRKYNPFIVIYMAGILLTLLNFSFNLSTFGIGLITAYCYFLTGTILASLIFQVSCNVAGVLLVAFYPRLITLTGFLF